MYIKSCSLCCGYFSPQACNIHKHKKKNLVFRDTRVKMLIIMFQNKLFNDLDCFLSIQ